MPGRNTTTTPKVPTTTTDLSDPTTTRPPTTTSPPANTTPSPEVTNEETNPPTPSEISNTPPPVYTSNAPTPVATNEGSKAAAKTTAPVASNTHKKATSTSEFLLAMGISAVVMVVMLVIILLVKKRRKRRSEEPQMVDSATNSHLQSADVNAGYLELQDTRSGPTLQNTTFEEMHSAASARPGLSSIEDLLLRDPEIVAVRLPTSDLQQHDRIGRGTYGKVYKGMLYGRTVAIKRLVKEVLAHGDGPQVLKGFVSEVQLMVHFHHPNLVTVIGVAWDSESLAKMSVVFEFMDRGDLRQNLVEFERNGRPKVFDQEKVRIARDIAKGLAYLHAQTPKVIHRDLKSRNILLNSQMQAKLSDFGISRRLSEHTLTMTAGTGTNLWMAPEVLMGQRYNEKADMFSFGVVLSELNTHALPYSDARDHEGDTSGHRLPEVALLQQVALGFRRVQFINAASFQDQVLATIGSACVDLHPKSRPTATEIVEELERLLNQWTESHQ